MGVVWVGFFLGEGGWFLGGGLVGGGGLEQVLFAMNFFSCSLY